MTQTRTTQGQAEKEGRGVWCGKAMAQYQIRQNPTQPQAPSSPAQKTSSGKLNRSPKTYRSSYEQLKKINTTVIFPAQRGYT